MRTAGKATLFLLFIPLLIPASSAQTGLTGFTITHDDFNPFVDLGQSLDITLRVTDTSSPTTQALGGHRVSLQRAFEPGQDTLGWSVLVVPPTLNLLPGETKEAVLKVTPDKLTRQSQLDFFVKARFTGPDGAVDKQLNFTVATFGSDSFLAIGGAPLQMGPGEIQEGIIRITNGALKERNFGVEVRDNPCGLQTATSASVVVPAKTTKEVTVSVVGPEDQFRNAARNCRLGLVVTPLDAPLQVSASTLIVIVNGWYVDPAWVFTAIGIFIAAFLIFLLVARRKARIEEEILGRPQKPWTIPVEMVYLDHLKERDPQAHYVVRHYLMEEEYSSALAWYREYKKATKGSRSKERLVVNQEHKYARFGKKWEKRIAKPQKEVDRLAVGLQKKLDRRGKKGLRKDRRKWKKLTKKMKAAHTKKQERATKKWEKKAKRAEKKKQPVPEKPILATPDYPPEPSKDKVELAKHPWNAKVEKARRKAVKKQGNLEVKFEKEDAKMLRKVRKRVQKIARKLDDPDFAAEHPILAKDAKSS